MGQEGRTLGSSHNADASQNELVEHALGRGLALRAQTLGQVGDGTTGLLEHVGHAAGDIGGACVLAHLLTLGIEVVEDLLATLDGNSGGAEAHVNGTVNKLIEFHNHGCLQSQTTALAFLYPRLSESDKAFKRYSIDGKSLSHVVVHRERVLHGAARGVEHLAQ